jgi:hypothetical protein
MIEEGYRKLQKVLLGLFGFSLLFIIPTIIWDLDILMLVIAILFILTLGPFLVIFLALNPDIKKAVRQTYYIVLAAIILFIFMGLVESITAVFKDYLVSSAGIILVLCLGLVIAIPDKGMVRNLWILIALIIVGFSFKRFHLPGSGLILVSAGGTLAAGSFLFSIRLLLTVKKNPYLKWIGFISSLLICIATLSVIFKYQHWVGTGILIQASLIPIILLTIIVLLTLPSSGFIQWSTEHKHILTRRLLIPWVYFLILISLNLLLPPAISRNIFEDEIRKVEPFEMRDYPIHPETGPVDQ